MCCRFHQTRKIGNRRSELGEELLSDRKNREEHQYVVNMISDVFETYCTDFKIPKMPKLMKIRDIQHLFTPVEGNLGKGYDIFQFSTGAASNTGTRGCSDEFRMEIIRNEEEMDRGYYAAPIGWTDTAGNGEFAVAIRSALLEGRSSVFICWRRNCSGF